MSAVELRQAASLLRERANVATSAPWKAWSGSSAGGGEYITSETGEVFGISPHRSGDFKTANLDAAYIATVHPGVGLALADWLDTVGADIFAYGPPEPAGEAQDDDLLNPHLLHGLTLARLINGSES